MNDTYNRGREIEEGGSGVKALLRRKLPPEVVDLYRSTYKAVRDFVVRRRARRGFRWRLRQGGPLWLDLGAGRVPGRNGWTTVDGEKGADIQFNLLNRFPLPDESVEKIYSSHALEHFFYVEMMGLLRECHRILKPGGTISICVPDATIYIAGYQNPEPMREREAGFFQTAFHYHTPIDYLNYIAYMWNDHRHLFDESNLIAILRAASFQDVIRRDFDPALDLPAKRHESIYATGRKP
ncbi:MAG: methyltransferase domain-containing protein [Verrucomicrobia bacterium]|nr:methyltransferase domain-containing protein [Verrucomicrobiota bacterium]